MSFLKSISLAEDLSVPVRACHYRPTSKSIDILRSITGARGSRATSVVATYGSGKSLAAMVASILVDGDPDKIEALEPAHRRLMKFDPALAEWMEARIGRGQRGAVIALAGHVPDLPSALMEAIGGDDVETMSDAVKALERHLSNSKSDRLAIVWDEFGRHLETLAGKGRAEDLAQLQDLAEWTMRRKAPSATLTLLLHQDFHRYAGRLGQTDQSGWRKIEGRFDILRIVEDSDEIYDLIADVVSELTKSGRARLTNGTMTMVQDLGFFPFAEGERCKDLLRRAAPLSPTAFYLLPRIAGRIGQSERTIFGFLGAELPEDRSETVTIEDLYRHFSDAMRADTAVGGTHKRFVETEAARSRAVNSLEREIIAGASLLHLAATGETARVSRERLVKAMDLGSTHSRRKIEEAVDNLLDRKLLLHRTLTDEITVWEGSDVDVRTRAQEEMDQIRTAGDPLDRVKSHVPAPHYVGEAYNHTYAMTRYAKSVFVSAATLLDPKSRRDLLTEADQNDALVALVVDASAQDFKNLGGSWMKDHPHFIIALADQSPDLDMASLEADAFARLEHDELLLEMDPRVAREVSELKGDILEFLLSRAASLTDPGTGTVNWFSQNKCLGAGPDLRPGEILSQIFKTRFPLTPRIANEQIVRRKVTPQTKSARKRLLLGILERSDLPFMGYKDYSTSDASMFRTTLVAPGLFDDQNGQWRSPADLRDEGMREVWSRIEDFYTSPGTQTRSFTEITHQLTQSPLGIRPGLIPIFLTAGLRAFANLVAIRKQTDGRWVYLDDIVPSIMEEIAENPDSFEIEVIKATAAQKKRIAQLTAEFSPIPDRVETDLIRAFHDAVSQWMRALPPAAMTARGLGMEADALQPALRQTRADPVHLLLRAFPSIACRKRLDDKTLAFVSEGRKQMERVTDRYAAEAIHAVKDAFGAANSDENALSAAKAWADRVPQSLTKNAAIDSVSRAILNRARRTDSGSDTERSFARALSAMLLGLDFEEWDDGVSREYARDLKGRLREIEDAILSAEDLDETAAPFLTDRIRTYMKLLEKTSGKNATDAMLAELKGVRE